jgi:tetratricopeptide (TPR) repeat protein
MTSHSFLVYDRRNTNEGAFMRWTSTLSLVVGLFVMLSVASADDDVMKAERHARKGTEYAEQGKFDLAIKELDQAVQLDAKNALVFSVRGAIRFRMKEYDKAITDLDEAIRLSPNKATSGYYIRGSAWYMKKEYAKGVTDFDEAIRLNPKEYDALNGRAWAAATCPEAKYRDAKKAVEYAKQACDIKKWQDPFSLGTLAAAYAEAGDFAAAVEWLEKAMKDKVYLKEYGEEAEKMLKLYQAKKPYREEPSKTK